MTATEIVASQPSRPVRTTLLALVARLEPVADDEGALVEAVQHLTRSGRVVLTGNFRGCSLD